MFCGQAVVGYFSASLAVAIDWTQLSASQENLATQPSE